MRKGMPEKAFGDAERELDHLEPAWADCLLALRTGERYMRDTPAVEKVRVRSLIDVHQEFEGHRQRFEAGHAEALIGALALAMEENLPVPYWASREARARFRSVMSLDSDSPLSLHQAFGLEGVIPTSSKRYRKERHYLKIESVLWVETRRIMDTGLALDPAIEQVLKTKVGGIGKTTARRLFLRRDAIQKTLLKPSARRHSTR